MEQGSKKKREGRWRGIGQPNHQSETFKHDQFPHMLINNIVNVNLGRPACMGNNPHLQKQYRMPLPIKDKHTFSHP